MKIKDIIFLEVNKGKKRKLIQVLKSLYADPSTTALFMYRLAKKCYDSNYRVLAKFLKKRLVIKYGLHVSLKAEIGIGLQFRHVNGVVIGEGVKIGKNCTIYQQVTFGGQNLGDAQLGNYPVVGDDVTIFAGAKILGNVSVGNNVIIGANSVVINDVDENCIYAGIPARFIKKNEKQTEKYNHQFRSKESE